MRHLAVATLLLLLTGLAVSDARAQTAVDETQLAALEQTARDWLDFMVKAQRQGAMATSVVYDPEADAVQPYTTVPNDDSASGLGVPLLWAARLWEEPGHRKAVSDLADFYSRAQFPEGGWAYQFTLQADGSVTPVWQIANFEEWVQSNGLRMLVAAHLLTGEERFKEAAAKAGEIILAAQHESGWWPWGHPVGPEDRRGDHLKGPTLNDWSLNACMGDCLVMYHLTGDERYRDALLKAGEWLIAAQIPDPTPGWAAQYTPDNEPRWARYMEPPGVDCTFGTQGGGAALLMLYDMTGEDRYLAPLRKHLAFLESIPQDKKGWLWYAHRSWTVDENKGTVSDYTKGLTERFGGTLPSEESLAGIAIEQGEPIIAYHYQMVPVDHPERDCYLTPLNGHYGSRSERAESWLRGELDKRADGPILDGWRGPVAASQRQDARPTQEACARAYSPASVAEALDRLSKWREGEAADGGVMVDLRRGCADATAVLYQIALGRVALGKADPSIIPMYRQPTATGNFPLVDPARDWYAVEVEQ